MSSVFRTWKIWVQFSGFIFWGRDLERKREKKSKNVQSSKNAQNCSLVSKRVLGQVFLEKFFCSVFHGVIENFRKIQNFSKIQKCPKSFPILSKLALNMFWGDFSEKQFRPVFHGWSSLRKFSKQSKKHQNSEIALNRFQKCPNVFWTCFGAIFRIFFAQ